MRNDGIVLTEAQRRAVEWEGGPLLVLAGPGAGKTEILAERAVRIIRSTPKRRFRVLGMTFTNFAAGEMKDRVALRLGRESERARFGTFHSFCAGVLRQHGSHLGLRPDFRILTLDGDRALVLADALGPRAPWGSQPPPAERIGRNLDQLFRTDPEDLRAPPHTAGAGSEWGRGLIDAYVSELIRNNCMDFGALLFCCLRLVRSKNRIAQDLPVAYPHVLVDEYQDTNAIQDRLLRELWPPGTTELFVVADDDQTIFQWNGANPERIASLKADYAMTALNLPETYRCAPQVILRANRLLAAGPPGSLGKGPLVASGPADSDRSVRVRAFQTEGEEFEWVVGDIQTRGVPSGECVILARTGRLVEAAYEALVVAGIPAWRRQPRDQFVSPGIRYLLAALRLANAPRDGAQLRLLIKALFELTGVGVPVASVEERAEVENGALLAGFAREVSADTGLAGRLTESVRKQLLERSDYRQFASRALEIIESDLKETRDDGARAQAQEEIDVWRSLSVQIRRQGGERTTLTRFLHELDLRPIVSEPKQDQVRCLTIHQAKGKGFPYVYLIGLAEDLLPSWHAKKLGDAGPGIQEERRNCFVAITRASKTLTLTYAGSYFGWEKDPSRFLADMGLRALKSHREEWRRSG